jgi:hypothetical protein
MKNTSVSFKEAVKRQDYHSMASLFLADTKTTLTAEYLKTDKHFQEDKTPRDIYKVTIKRGYREFSFNFGQSLSKSKKYKDRLTKDIILLNGKFENLNKRVIPEKLKEYIRDYCIEVKGKKPTEYDILACLTKYEVGSFENFCSDFCYDTDSRKAERIYKDVLNEWQNVKTIWSDDEIEALQKIY